MATLQHRTHPYTDTFFALFLPLLRVTKPKVFQRFVEYTGMPEREAELLLLPGYEPSVVIKSPRKAIEIAGRLGYTPSTGGEIWLHVKLADGVESLLGGGNYSAGVWNYYETKSAVERGIRVLLEATVLHELVHYARQKTHAALSRSKEEAIAQRFEIAAYGEIHTVHSLGLDNLMGDPADD